MAEKMGNLKRTHYCNEISEDLISTEVTLMGWVAKQRSLGSIIFVDLRDRSGIAQIVFDDTSDRELLEKANRLRGEFVIAVKGKIRERSSINEELKTGKVEVLASELKILSESDVPPIYIKDND
ncbi:MAG: OB-fold nucleic acid binding domain-containing protein, partial [Peptoniphilus lacydonensis]|nr:OB-fold nucleic acid binding domain-containing protein [Peptoniphilus lacydonensis]